MSVMICGLILCGLGLEAFRLSMAAGAIQANLSRRKMICLGGIFAAVQLVLFFLGTGIWLACGNFLPASEKIHILARVSSVLFIVLGCVFLWLGIRGKRMEESRIQPWSVDGFTKYALKHGLMFLTVGCGSTPFLGNKDQSAVGIYLFLFLAAVTGLAYGYWQGIKGWQKMRIMTGGIWMVTAICFWII